MSCAKLNCDENAECAVSPRDGAPSCSCIAGYRGDGRVCAIVPSDVRISGRVVPAEEIGFDNSDDDDDEVRFSHVYTVSNVGVHTVGGLVVHVVWPLKAGLKQTNEQTLQLFHRNKSPNGCALFPSHCRTPPATWWQT